MVNMSYSPVITAKANDNNLIIIKRNKRNNKINHSTALVEVSGRGGVARSWVLPGF